MKTWIAALVVVGCFLLVAAMDDADQSAGISVGEMK